MTRAEDEVVFDIYDTGTLMIMGINIICVERHDAKIFIASGTHALSYPGWDLFG